MKTRILLLIAVIAMYSCGEPIAYKYQNKEMDIACAGIDPSLLKEALYSFENDISAYYNNEQYSPGSAVYFEFGYANFIYPGATGTADYAKIASSHTIAIMHILKKEESLWNKNAKDSKLNYKHPFVKCLIENIDNKEIKEKIETLQSVNYFTPTIMSEFYRVHVGDALTDKHFALFIALETYYQNLLEIDFSAMSKNE